MHYEFVKKNYLGLFIFSIALSALAADAPKCLDEGKIRYRKFGKMVEEKASYCFDKAKESLESSACQKKGSCEATNIVAKKNDQDIAKSANAAFGTPGFQACRFVGGEPQIIEYFDGAGWTPADRCNFKSDGSFINTARLLQKN